VDVQLPVLQAVDHLRVDVDPGDLQPIGSEGAGGGQSNVAQSQDTDFLEFHRDSFEEFNAAGIIS